MIKGLHIEILNLRIYLYIRLKVGLNLNKDMSRLLILGFQLM